MADMLTDALLQSNRFIVLDRQTVKDVLQEQDLAATLTFWHRYDLQNGFDFGNVLGHDE
jgi:curli biogenesis system outer membrane secretion channel CsgG